MRGINRPDKWTGIDSLVWASWLQSVSPKAKAEIEQAVKQIETELSALQSENQRLQEEVDGLRQDKERLDWFENANDCGLGRPFAGDQVWWLFFDDEGRDVSGLTFRAVIDAAMAHTSPTPSEQREEKV